MRTLPVHFWVTLAKQAEQVFLAPDEVYPWNDIIQGVAVTFPNGRVKTFRAVAPNTFRGHRRIDTSKPGSITVFQPYFLNRRRHILRGLKAVRTRHDLHQLLNEITEDIRLGMTNIQDAVRNSFNRVRKPVDLYIEHLVAMAREISPALRQRLVPLLFLPLDSVMLNPIPIPGHSPIRLFDPNTLAGLDLSTQPSYGHVSTQAQYEALQTLVDDACQELTRRCKRTIHPIYLDLLWRKRFTRTGGNLFKLNPPGPSCG